MKNITIIVPVHVFDETLLNRAINSIPDKENELYTLLFVGPKDICKKSEKLAKKCGIKFQIVSVENDDTDIQTQINKAVFSCVTKYFTVLEFDDEFTDIYFNVMQIYVEQHPELSVILPVNEFCDTDGKMISFGNEIALDPSFSESVDGNEDLGLVGLGGLEVFMDFNCTGGLIKTEDFISVGGLKKSLKIASWYEYLMRVAYNDKKIMVIPKIGYRHMINRPGSYLENAKTEISKEEGQFLIKTAKQEYFFKDDRNKVFGENNES